MREEVRERRKRFDRDKEGMSEGASVRDKEERVEIGEKSEHESEGEEK